MVNDEAPDGSSAEQQTATRIAASAVLSLPWELLHDGRSYLFQGNHPACVRRRLPNRHSQPALATVLPIRILLVSPRPEDERTSYIDHRVSRRLGMQLNRGQHGTFSVTSNTQLATHTQQLRRDSRPSIAIWPTAGQAGKFRMLLLAVLLR